MNKAGAITVLGIVCVAVAVIVLRWPRIEPGMVRVTRSEASSRAMEMEYRMSEPFYVTLEHEIRERVEMRPGTGLHVSTSKPLRSELGGRKRGRSSFSAAGAEQIAQPDPVLPGGFRGRIRVEWPGSTGQVSFGVGRIRIMLPLDDPLRAIGVGAHLVISAWGAMVSND